MGGAVRGAKVRSAITLTVGEMVAKYKIDLERKHGKGWLAVGGGRVAYALKGLVEFCGKEDLAKFGPLKLKGLRRKMIAGEKLCRKEINARVTAIKKAFGWASTEGLMHANTWYAISAIGGLGHGGLGSRDNAPRGTVSREVVMATIEYIATPFDTVVKLICLTGGRPSEILNLRHGDINRNRPNLWIAKFGRNKSSRVITFNRKAQELLNPFISHMRYRPLFRRDSGEAFDHRALRKAVERGLREANGWRKVNGLELLPHWTPYMITKWGER